MKLISLITFVSLCLTEIFSQHPTGKIFLIGGGGSDSVYNAIRQSVENHFDADGRLVRLLAALRSIGLSHGFGVGEGTALSIQDNFTTVYGSYGVWIVDTSSASYPEDEDYFCVTNVRVHYLTESDSYNRTSGKVVTTKPTLIPEEKDVPDNQNIFGTRQALRLMISLVSSTANISKGYSNELDPECMVIFEKDEKTKTYASGQQYTVENLLIHVGTRT